MKYKEAHICEECGWEEATSEREDLSDEQIEVILSTGSFLHSTCPKCDSPIKKITTLILFGGSVKIESISAVS